MDTNYLVIHITQFLIKLKQIFFPWPALIKSNSWTDTILWEEMSVFKSYTQGISLADHLNNGNKAFMVYESYMQFETCE